MNLKHLVTLFVVLVQVNSECDDYLTCVSDFIRGFFYIDSNGTFVENGNVSEFNLEDLEDETNAPIKYFEIEDFGKSLEMVLSDVTSLIKDEIKENLKIISESNIFQNIDNKTNVYVKTYNLDTRNEEINIENGTELNLNNFNTTNYKENEDLKKVTNNIQIVFTDNECNTTKNSDVEKSFDTFPIMEKKILPQDFTNTVTTSSTTVPTSSTTATKTTDNIETKTYFFIPESVIKIEENIDTTKTIAEEFTSVLKTELPAMTTIEPKLFINDFTTKLPTIIENTDVVDIPNKTQENAIGKVDLTTILLVKSTTDRTATKTPNTIVYNITKVHEFNDIINIRENEISNYEIDYEIEDNTTDYPIIDYIDLYKDTTNENVVYNPTDIPISGKNDLDNVIDLKEILLSNSGDNSDTLRNENETIDAMVPWIATIFIKNGSTSQFEYVCDGALLSERIVLTAARCVMVDKAMSAENFIIILGKKSLIASAQSERIHKVKELKLHESFTSGSEENDLAVLILEEPAVFSDVIQPACLDSEAESKEGLTTGWALYGQLTLIYFQNGTSETCVNRSMGNTFCSTYGNDVTTCPSYGGLYANKQTDKMCLKGIRTGNPAERGFCIERTVVYTSLKHYTEWITAVLRVNK